MRIFLVLFLCVLIGSISYFPSLSVGWKALLIKKKKKAQKHACSIGFFVDMIESNSLCKGSSAVWPKGYSACDPGPVF